MLNIEGFLLRGSAQDNSFKIIILYLILINFMLFYTLDLYLKQL